MYSIFKGLILVLFFNVAFEAKSQLNSKQIDSLSYRYWEAKQWDSIIQFKDKLPKELTDFYWFNVRLADAFYHQKKYTDALHFYELAHAQNKIESYPLLMMLETSLYLGWKQEAESASKKLKSNYGFNYLKLTQNAVAYTGLYFLTQPASIGRLTPNNQLQYFEIEKGSSHQFYYEKLKNKLQFKFQYEYLGLNYKQHLYSVSNPQQYSFSFIQHQYYGLVGYQIQPKLKLLVAGHFLNSSSKTANVLINQNPPYRRRLNTADLTSNSSTSFALFGGFEYRMNNFITKMNYSYSNFNSTTQHQSQASLTHYPFKNNSIFYALELNYHLQNQTSIFFPAIRVYGTINKNTYFNAMVSSGGTGNFTDQNISVVINTSDIVDYRIGAGITRFFGTRISASFNYNFQKRSSSAYLSGGNNEGFQTVNSQIHLPVISIKYNF